MFGIAGCGLVMKEDIKQRQLSEQSAPASCGLVMKEDIKQLEFEDLVQEFVVVW